MSTTSEPTTEPVLEAMLEEMFENPAPDHPIAGEVQRSDARRVLRAALEAAGLRGFKMMDLGFGEECEAFDCEDPKLVLERLADAAGMEREP